MADCIIMHNIIIEAERGPMVINTNFDNIGTQISPTEARQNVTERETFVNAYHKICNCDLELQSDLIGHNWCDMLWHDNTWRPLPFCHFNLRYLSVLSFWHFGILLAIS
jgi:hypothetical protein